MPRTDRSGPSPRGGTGTCFRRRRRSSLGGRPSTTSTSMRRPPSAPPSSTAVIVGPVSRSEAPTFPTRIRCRAGALKRAASGAGICIRSGGDDADGPVSAVSLNMRRHGAQPRGATIEPCPQGPASRAACSRRRVLLPASLAGLDPKRGSGWQASRFRTDTLAKIVGRAPCRAAVPGSPGCRRTTSGR